MRCPWSMIFVVVGTALVLPSPLRAEQSKSPTAQAQKQQQKGASTQGEVTVDEDQKQRAAALAQTASAQEQKMAQRVRWVEMQLKKEEKLLGQRLAYAARIRATGLEKNDQNLLKQAEDYERRSLLAFEQKVKQFERMLQTSAAQSSSSNGKSVQTSPRRSQQARPTRSRSTQKPHPNSRLIRRR